LACAALGAMNSRSVLPGSLVLIFVAAAWLLLAGKYKTAFVQPLATTGHRFLSAPGQTSGAGSTDEAAGLKGVLVTREGRAVQHAKGSVAALCIGASVTALIMVARSRRGRTVCFASEDVRQILGMKGASDEEVPLWKIRIQLLKPVTWPPLILGCISGVAACGNWEATPQNIAALLTAMFVSGPCMTGFTQTINDWYDREIDAINEPYRPIPSGKITEEQVWQQIYATITVGLSLALGLDAWAGHLPGVPSVFLVALFGAFLAYIYSAPPFKLKTNGWLGNYALGWSYVCLPWWCGQALFGTLTPEIIVVTTLYSAAAIGVAVVNDFKSIDGDRQLGLQSIPVMYGIETSKWITAGFIDGIQLLIVAWLFYINEPNYAAGLLALMVPQVVAQKALLFEDPIANDVKFQASSLPFFQIGIIVAAAAVGDSPYH